MSGVPWLNLVHGHRQEWIHCAEGAPIAEKWHAFDLLTFSCQCSYILQATRSSCASMLLHFQNIDPSIMQMARKYGFQASIHTA